MSWNYTENISASRNNYSYLVRDLSQLEISSAQEPRSNSKSTEYPERNNEKTLEDLFINRFFGINKAALLAKSNDKHHIKKEEISFTGKKFSKFSLFDDCLIMSNCYIKNNKIRFQNLKLLAAQLQRPQECIKGRYDRLKNINKRNLAELIYFSEKFPEEAKTHRIVVKRNLRFAKSKDLNFKIFPIDINRKNSEQSAIAKAEGVSFDAAKFEENLNRLRRNGPKRGFTKVGSRNSNMIIEDDTYRNSSKTLQRPGKNKILFINDIKVNTDIVQNDNFELWLKSFKFKGNFADIQSSDPEWSAQLLADIFSACNNRKVFVDKARYSQDNTISYWEKDFLNKCTDSLMRADFYRRITN
jgi:hypothetical protein